MKNATKLDKIKIYAYILKLSLKKQKRDKLLVDNEYNLGQWNKEIDKIDFETLSGNYSRDDYNDEVVLACDDKLMRAVWGEIAEQSHDEFLSIFEKYKEEHIIELGCGLGANLFSLYKNGFKKLEGCDISKNAIERTLEYTKTNKINIGFEECDLNEPFRKDMIKNKIVFTHGCLEQCKHIMSTVIKNIIDGKPKLVINFEVDYDSSEFMVKKYLDARDYQNNFVRELKKLEANGKVEILSITKRHYSLSPVNRPSLIIWKPT